MYTQMTQKLAVLGSTGTIGRFTLEIVERYPEQFKVVALSAGKNLELLRQQILRFDPLYVCVEGEVGSLPSEFPKVKFLKGAAGLEEVASAPEADTVITGVVG